MGPVRPVFPVAPSVVFRPVGPVRPVGPTPVGPVDPVAPVGPTTAHFGGDVVHASEDRGVYEVNILIHYNTRLCNLRDLQAVRL